MKTKTRDMMWVAMFAALTAIGAFMRIETPLVPITLQFAFCAFSGVLLGAKKGALSQTVYVTIGLMGFPVFTRGGGPYYVLEPTFGYLVGFIACAYLIGKMTERITGLETRTSLYRLTFAVISGLGAVYLLGVVHLYLVVNWVSGHALSIPGALFAGVVPFIAGDVLVGMLVVISSRKVIPVLRTFQPSLLVSAE